MNSVNVYVTPFGGYYCIKLPELLWNLNSAIAISTSSSSVEIYSVHLTIDKVLPNMMYTINPNCIGFNDFRTHLLGSAPVRYKLTQKLYKYEKDLLSTKIQTI
ncbi:MAG: hypothetical protein DRI54_08590 [Bacteroidetes bacterium]|nr:MAG: hypothetical protein DRI54_08590 [Bacteroidota bacterium]